MESGLHRKQMDLLCNTLDDALARQHVEDVYVAGNMAIYYSALQAKKNDFKAPDVFVVLDVEGRHERKSWVVWEEDLRTPNLVVELLSESTESNDRGPKMRVYEKLLRVPNYVLFDPIDFRLEGYRLVDGEYVALAPDADGGSLGEKGTSRSGSGQAPSGGSSARGCVPSTPRGRSSRPTPSARKSKHSTPRKRHSAQKPRHSAQKPRHSARTPPRRGCRRSWTSSLHFERADAPAAARTRGSRGAALTSTSGRRV
jgi:hypothetical protein